MVLFVYLRSKLFMNQKKACSEISQCSLQSYNPLITRNNKANFDKILIITALQNLPHISLMIVIETVFTLLSL